MFDRKEVVTKNKKYFISNEYLRKIFESKQSRQNIRYQNENSDFKKIEPIQKINVSNDHPMVLFHKSNHDGFYSIENRIKKELIENKGYIDDGGYKKKLLKFYSHHNTDQSQSKNLYRSKNKNINRSNENKNFFNSNRTSFSMGLNKRTIQKDYSNSIKKVSKRPKIIYEIKKNKEKGNNLFNSLNVQDIENRNSLIKKLTNKKVVKNLLYIKNNNTINIKERSYKRKKDYLEHFNISYDKENGNENVKNDQLKDLKDIPFKNKIFNEIKSSNNNINNNDKRKKKKYKDNIKQFEFIHKIKKELHILQQSNEKNKSSKKN